MSTVENIPSFGPTNVPRYNRIPFTFSYYREEEIETQRFNLLDKKMDMGSAGRMLRMQSDTTGQALPEIIAIIGKHLDDKDGTPCRWTPVEVAPKKGDPDTLRFRGPDGKIYPMEHAAAFLEPAKWSSRRRWLHLMNEDDTAAVEEAALQKLMEFIVEVAAKRPTHASS